MLAATRPGPLVAPPVRSCCSQGAVAATGLARTPLRRPTWLAASLDWLRTPSEAPWNFSCGWTQVPREGITGQSITDAQQRQERGSQTAPCCPHVPQCGGLRGTCSVPRGGGGDAAGKLFCECMPVCPRVCQCV